jgi:hypothetical protein
MKNRTIPVVINKCFGGYSISPEAALWLYERGFRGDGFVTPVEEYWKGSERRDEALSKWRDYLRKERSARDSLFITVFTPDEKFVLNERPEPRTDPLLVECVRTLGKAANGACARLEIIEIPESVDWEIDEYDGNESIHEKHRSWG